PGDVRQDDGGVGRGAQQAVVPGPVACGHQAAVDGQRRRVAEPGPVLVVDVDPDPQASLAQRVLHLGQVLGERPDGVGDAVTGLAQVEALLVGGLAVAGADDPAPDAEVLVVDLLAVGEAGPVAAVGA